MYLLIAQNACAPLKCVSLPYTTHHSFVLTYTHARAHPWHMVPSNRQWRLEKGHAVWILGTHGRFKQRYHSEESKRSVAQVGATHGRSMNEYFGACRGNMNRPSELCRRNSWTDSIWPCEKRARPAKVGVSPGCSERLDFVDEVVSCETDLILLRERPRVTGRDALDLRQIDMTSVFINPEDAIDRLK